MERRRPLRRRGTLPPGRPLERRSRLRARSEAGQARAEELAAQAGREARRFFLEIKGRRCVVCGRSAREARAAGTRHQAHHAVSKLRLKRLGLEAHLWDPRNAVCCCEEPCHRRHTDAVERIPAAALPAQVWEFAAELGCSHVIEREYS